MTEEEILGRVAYEARRTFYYETRMDCIRPWEAQSDEIQQSFIALAHAVASYVKRDLAGKQFSAYVAAGGIAIEQQLAELQARQQRIEEYLQELQEHLHHDDTPSSPASV